MADAFLRNADGTLRCPAFDQFPWQAHGFGTRQSHPATDVTLRQVHSSLVFDASGLKDRGCEGDALVTDEVGLSIGVRTADCVPILLLDSTHCAVAAVHAGWRGTDAGILQRAIQKMAQRFRSSPAQIWAAIGPCIQECCYEVGPEVWQRFHPDEKADGKRQLDLAAANSQQLTATGVPKSQIFDSGLCTFCQADMFYSFRREPGEPGRMISAILRLA